MWSVGRSVVISVLLSFVSGLIMPTKKTNGDPDMDSVINHVTLMEQTVASLQAQVVAGNTELATVKGELKSSKDEITAVKTELRLAETDISVLKTNLQRSPDPVAFAQLKTEFETLKVSHNALVQQVNLTVIDAVSADVKTNTREIMSLKSELIKTETIFNNTNFDLLKTRADVVNVTSEMSLMNVKLNQSIQDVISNKVDIDFHKSQLTDVTKFMNTTSNKLHSFETQIIFVETGYSSFRSIQNITQHEVAECRALAQSTAADMKMVKTQVNTVANLTSEVSIMNTNLNQSIHDSVSNNADITILKTQLNDVTKSINTASTNINSLETRLTSAETQYNTLRSRQNITDHEVAESKTLAQSTAADLKTIQTQVTTISTDVNGLRGELTVIKNKSDKDVAFQITKQGGSATGWTTLKFDTVEYNTGSGYNQASGMFRAPVSGTYIFWANVVFSNPVGNHYIYIYKGSTRLATGLGRVDDDADYGMASTMTTTHLDVGDQVHFTTDSTGNHMYGYGRSSYGGALLHAS